MPPRIHAHPDALKQIYANMLVSDKYNELAHVDSRRREAERIRGRLARAVKRMDRKRRND